MNDPSAPTIDELIDRIYSVAVTPQRLEELACLWRERLSSTDGLSSEAASLDPHLQRAVWLLDQQGDAVTDTNAPGDNDATQPALLINWQGDIVESNTSAQALYGVRSGHSVNDLPLCSGSLKLLSQAVAQLRERTAGAARQPTLLRLARRDNDQPVLVTVTASPDLPGHVTLRTTEIVCSRRLLQILANTFELTETETEIARLLIEGKSVNDIASDRNNSVATIRVHVRALLAKTGTHSQPEFLRMTWGLDALLENSGDGDHSTVTDAAPRPLATERFSLTLQDGRTLAYAMFGAREGEPVLFMHDNILGDAWPGALAAEARRRNLTVIAPARPHFAGTTGYPEHCDPLRLVAADCMQLLDHMAVAKYTILSRTTGSAFAAALAIADPARCRGMVALSPALPMREAGDYNRLNDHARFVALGARFQASALLLACRAGEAFYRRAGARRYVKAVLARSKPDRRLCDDPTLMAVMAQGCQFQDNSHAFYQELLHLQSCQHPTPSDVPCPVHIITGEQDTNRRRQQAQAMLDRGSDFTLTAIPDAGALFFYSHGSEVLDALQALQLARTKKS